MDDFMAGVVTGIITVLLFLAAWIMSPEPKTIYGRAVEAIEKCERTLPRNKNCVLTAEPEKTNENNR